MRAMDAAPSADLVAAWSRKMAPPLVTLLSSEPEVQYVALRNINLVVQKRPSILANEVKVRAARGQRPPARPLPAPRPPHCPPPARPIARAPRSPLPPPPPAPQVFFCKYNDPLYVKMEKLEVMIRLANDKNIDQVLLELKEYAQEVDVDFVRKARKRARGGAGRGAAGRGGAGRGGVKRGQLAGLHGGCVARMHVVGGGRGGRACADGAQPPGARRRCARSGAARCRWSRRPSAASTCCWSSSAQR